MRGAARLAVRTTGRPDPRRARQHDPTRPDPAKRGLGDHAPDTRCFRSGPMSGGMAAVRPAAWNEADVDA
jgi:hypothetical protein